MSTKIKKMQWHVSSLADATHLGVIEFQDRRGELHEFAVMQNTERIVFGGACNTGFLESGFIRREEDETTDDTLRELLSDLQTYYDDGAAYVSRIVCNARM